MIYAQTDRLRLRSMREEDCAIMVEYLNVWEVNAPLAVLPFPFTYGDANSFWDRMQKRYDNGRPEFFVIADKGTDELLGGIGIHAEHTLNDRAYVGEMGYWLGQPHWGQGYMREALLAVIRYIFAAHEYRMLVSTTDLDNVRSQHVLKSMGFSYQGEFKPPRPSLHGSETVTYWEILRETFEENDRS